MNLGICVRLFLVLAAFAVILSVGAVRAEKQTESAKDAALSTDSKKPMVQGQSRWPKDESAKQRVVEVYITENCVDCIRVVGFLDGAQVRYRLLHMDSDAKIEKQYMDRIGEGVIPVVKLGSNYVRGYLPDEIHKLIKPVRLVKTSGAEPKTGKVPWLAGLSVEDRETFDEDLEDLGD